MKTCITCHVSKPLDDFGNYKRYPDGKHRVCRACHNTQVNTHRWDKGTKPQEPLLERLWNNIQICAHGMECPFCCWPWLKGCDEDGYGKIGISNQGTRWDGRVSRVLWEIWNARLLSPDYAICHYCDNPPCANPMHFWRGTWVQNRMDCVQKGRQAKGVTSGTITHPEAFPRGEDKPAAKLTNQDVLTIRRRYADGDSANTLKREYHVSQFAILSIVHRKTWKHI